MLDAVCFTLAEYGPMAMHSGPVHEYLWSVWFPGSVQFVKGKCIISHTLDAAHLVLQKKNVTCLKAMILFLIQCGL